MGTNYYVNINGEKIHVGKCSCGWKFLFYKSNYIYDWETAVEVTLHHLITDEENNEILFPDFWHMVYEHQTEKTDTDCEMIDGYNFCEEEFS
jgi:acetone carboxylase gamma subunit